MPTARKNQAVFQVSKYSALATKVTRLRTTSGRNRLSINEWWLDARIAGPFFGTFSAPSTRTRKTNRNTGVMMNFNTQ
jgi:hypothetical protein